MAERRQIVVRTNLDEPYLRQLHEAFPQIDFLLATDDTALATVLGRAEVIVGGRPLTAEQVAAAPALRWIQMQYVGVDGWPLDLIAARGIALTTFGGVAAPQIADHVMALIYAFARNLPVLFERQRRREWPGWFGAPFPTFEPSGQTLAILGLGAIGTALARRASGIGMRVVAMRRTPGSPPPGVERVVGFAGLPGLLAEADHVVLALPSTAQTTGIIDAAALRLMRPTAYLYNVGRGQLIDQDALITALNEGWIGGVGLDVTDPEPLAPDSPLWDCPNVILTGHNSSLSPVQWERGIALFRENIGRYLAGEPLRNPVDFAAGY